MNKRLTGTVAFKTVAFQLLLSGGFVTVLSGGLGGLSTLVSGSPSEIIAEAGRVAGLRIIIPGDRAAVDPATRADFAALIRSSTAFQNGCLAGSSTDEVINSVVSASAENNLPPELLISMIIAESNCRASSVSARGARGLMQLSPATAKSLGVVKPHLAGQNVSGGAKYIAKLLERYNGDLSLALAAYNAGPTCVARYGDIPPFRETKFYVKKVVRLYNSVLFHTTGKGQLAQAA